MAEPTVVDDLSAQRGPSLSETSEQLMGRTKPLLEQSSKLTEKRAGRLEAGAAESEAEARAISDLARQQEAERAAARPAKPDLTKPPSTAARAFLEPGTSVLGQVQTIMQGIGQLAMGIAGTKGRGYAIAATAALKGAAEGWQAGDAERVKRSLAEWQTNHDHLMAQYQLERDQFNDLLTDQKLTMSERLAQMRMRAEILGQKDLADAFRLEDIDRSLKYLLQLDQHQIELKKATGAIDRWILSEDRRAREHAENLAERKRESDRADERARTLATDRNRERLDLSMMRGGPWINKKTGELVDNITRSEWEEAGGHDAFKPITKNQQQSIDILQAEAIPQIDQLKLLGDRILAKYPGQNLAKLVLLHTQGKLSDSDVREYGQARNAATFTLSRALGGSSAVRQFIFRAIDEAETPTLGDTKQTMNRMAENSRTAVVNFIRSAKGWTPFALPASARTVEGINDKGEIAQIKLAPYEPLPEGWRYRY